MPPCGSVCAMRSTLDGAQRRPAVPLSVLGARVGQGDAGRGDASIAPQVAARDASGGEGREGLTKSWRRRLQRWRWRRRRRQTVGSEWDRNARAGSPPVPGGTSDRNTVL